LEPPLPQMDLVHVHASPEELGRVYQAALPINSGMQGFARMARAMKPVDHSAWDAQTSAARAEYEEWQKHSPNAGNVQMGEIMAYLRNKLPKDAIVTNGAGNYATWFHRFYRWRSYRTQLAPTNGSMGYGVPAAVAAKLVHPDRIVLSANGDGCFLMNGQEIATAVQHNANVIFLVINNGMYGTIRMHQEREYPGRVSGTDLKNPDFAALARAYGAHGETVKETAEFAPAFERCLKAGKPSLIEIQLDPEALTPRLGLSQIRENALKSHANKSGQMSEGRIATELWVMAHIRQCSAQGIMATVVKRGDDWGGAVVIKLNLLGPGFKVLTQSRDIDGNIAWLQAKDGAVLNETDADEYIARQTARDPDLWVVEIEDRSGKIPFAGKLL